MSAPILLYDGGCAVCNRAVQFVLRHDRRGTLRFAMLDGETGRRVRAGTPAVAHVDSVLWVEESGAGTVVLDRSAAALAVARYLGGPWVLLVALRLVPRPWLDAAYDALARRRYGWFGHAVSCPVATPEQRRRFLDGRGTGG